MAFTNETPSQVIAVDCETCFSRIGLVVARDLKDFRRVHNLLKSSISK